jgi:Flp pilus assembly protein TadG
MTRPRARRRRGTSVVEFALTLPMLILAGLAVAQLGAFLGDRERFVRGAYDAARFAAQGLGGGQPTQEQVARRAQSILQAQGLPTEGLEVAVDRYRDGGEALVTVSISLPVRSLGEAVLLPATHSQRLTLVERGS